MEILLTTAIAIVLFSLSAVIMLLWFLSKAFAIRHWQRSVDITSHSLFWKLMDPRVRLDYFAILTARSLQHAAGTNPEFLSVGVGGDRYARSKYCIEYLSSYLESDSLSYELVSSLNSLKFNHMPDWIERGYHTAFREFFKEYVPSRINENYVVDEKELVVKNYEFHLLPNVFMNRIWGLIEDPEIDIPKRLGFSNDNNQILVIDNKVTNFTEFESLLRNSLEAEKGKNAVGEIKVHYYNDSGLMDFMLRRLCGIDYLAYRAIEDLDLVQFNSKAVVDKLSIIKSLQEVTDRKSVVLLAAYLDYKSGARYTVDDKWALEIDAVLKSPNQKYKIRPSHTEVILPEA